MADTKVSALPAATTPLDGTGFVPIVQGGVSKQVSVANLRGLPSWAGKLHAAAGNGEPEFEWQWDAFWSAQTTALTPTGVTATVGRIWFYRSPYAIVLNRLRWWAVAGTAAASNFRFGIYNTAGTQILAPQTLTFTGTDRWTSHAISSLTLAADTGYYCCLSATATATTWSLKASAIPGAYPHLDASTPPNLRVNQTSPSHKTWYAQIPVTAGVQPATMPTLARAAAWTIGGIPSFFFDNDATA